jgi:hypothetical protein
MAPRFGINVYCGCGHLRQHLAWAHPPSEKRCYCRRLTVNLDRELGSQSFFASDHELLRGGPDGYGTRTEPE